MTGPSSAPRGEHVPAPGVTWETQLVRTERVVDETSGPDMNQPAPARPNRATRRAMQRAARRTK
ncbi:hypothetical protein OHB14_36575 [Streptomyces sp. NBC_01613]|uniref:hypothetical protein n=1 Tax=Streptomyces sp. NBC_01613 TaxID=2975896 RepID=UPI00386333D6